MLQKKLLLIITFLQPVYGYGSNWNNPSEYTKEALTLTTISILAGGVVYTGYNYIQQPVAPTPIIPIKNLATEHGNFPENFKWGVSTASTQNEGLTKNSFDQDYLRTFPGHEDDYGPGFACHSWKHWQDDIDKLVYLGVTSARSSIEWSRVQPTKDTFDGAAINKYVQIYKELVAQGIKPTVCLHHYSDPQWFLDEGGFTQEENIQYFTTFCEKMYDALHYYVDEWIIFSQPVAYAIKSYKVGMAPPFLVGSGLENNVILNLFKAHINVYDMMHNRYNTTQQGLQPQVGICHQIVQMKATNPHNPISLVIAYFADRLYNQTLLRTFTDGHLQGILPTHDIAYLAQAPEKFDFFALSYYCPKSFENITPMAPDAPISHQTADTARIIDNNGLYDAIRMASFVAGKRPIHIVESGIFPHNEEQRILYLNTYLSQVAQAIQDGYHVVGFDYWTFMDNYEWGKKNGSTQFGLYKNRVKNHATGQLEDDFRNHEVMLKEGGRHYKNIIAQQKQSSTTK